MNLQEQHWEKLFSNVTPEGNPYYGIWTVYSPSCEVMKQIQGIRTLRANADKTIITHTNQFPSPDGNTQEKQWQIDKATCNLPDGLAHPADPSKRALALIDEGSSAWVSKTLESGRGFSVELFLKQPNRNTSVGIIYNESGALEKILHLREQKGSFLDEKTEPEIKQLDGKWRGTKQAIAPDLNLSPVEEIKELILDPTGDKNETLFLPDGIVVNAPKNVQIGEEFELVAGKLISEKEYKRLTAKYDNTGTFTRLIAEVFQRED